MDESGLVSSSDYSEYAEHETNNKEVNSNNLQTSNASYIDHNKTLQTSSDHRVGAGLGKKLRTSLEFDGYIGDS